MYYIDIIHRMKEVAYMLLVFIKTSLQNVNYWLTYWFLTLRTCFYAEFMVIKTKRLYKISVQSVEDIHFKILLQDFNSHIYTQSK